jgi:hypothetical protein
MSVLKGELGTGMFLRDFPRGGEWKLVDKAWVELLQYAAVFYF